jgi:hypothetical protein
MSRAETTLEGRAVAVGETVGVGVTVGEPPAGGGATEVGATEVGEGWAGAAVGVAAAPQAINARAEMTARA